LTHPSFTDGKADDAILFYRTRFPIGFHFRELLMNMQEKNLIIDHEKPTEIT